MQEHSYRRCNNSISFPAFFPHYFVSVMQTPLKLQGDYIFPPRFKEFRRTDAAAVMNQL